MDASPGHCGLCPQGYSPSTLLPTSPTSKSKTERCYLDALIANLATLLKCKGERSQKFDFSLLKKTKHITGI